MTGPMALTRSIYRNVLEALYERALAGEVTPRLKERLRPLGLDLDRPLPTSLPITAYARCLQITAAEIYPDLSPEQGMYELARRLTRGYWTSPVGMATELLVRRVGPHRMLSWMGRIFRAVDTYSKVTVTEEGPRRFRVQTNAVDVPPGYGRGVMEEMLRMSGALEPHVEELGSDFGDAYRLSWKEEPGR